jgi:glycerol-3-phosphate dehydrogenase
MAVLPGGELGGKTRTEFTAEMARALPFLDPATLPRLVRTHGSDLPRVFANGPGAFLPAGLTEAELDWMKREEWARTAEDVLWRRSKLGLHMTPDEREMVGAAMG